MAEGTTVNYPMTRQGVRDLAVLALSLG